MILSVPTADQARGEAESELRRTGGPRRQGRLRVRLAETDGAEVLQTGDEGSVMAGSHTGSKRIDNHKTR